VKFIFYLFIYLFLAVAFIALRQLEEDLAKFGLFKSMKVEKFEASCFFSSYVFQCQKFEYIATMIDKLDNEKFYSQ